MKNVILLFAMAICSSITAQENDTWRWGIQWGFHGTRADFTDGMSNANAKFHANESSDGALDVVFRYDLDARWMATFGLGVNTYGFNFALSNNYSLLNPHGRWTGLNASFAEFTTPIMLHYKFKQNCRNSRWIIGAGFVPTFNESSTIQKSDVNDPESSIDKENLKFTAISSQGTGSMVRFVVGKEKQLKSGRILNASWIFNVGLKAKSTATVNYFLDNTHYEHEFTTNGNFVGFRLSYFFKPWLKIDKRD
jgi:hypothetical protein